MEPGTSIATGPLTDDEWSVWRGFVDWSARVRRDVADEVTRVAGISFPDFEVLVRLNASDGELGQRELLASLGWSPSRLSHQLRRMGERDQLEREDLGEGRLVTVRLLPAGRQAIERSLEVLGPAVRQALLADLSEDVLEYLVAQHPGSPRAL